MQNQKIPMLQVQLHVAFDVYYEKGGEKETQTFSVNTPQEMLVLTDILFKHVATGETFKEIGHPLFGAMINGYNLNVTNMSDMKEIDSDGQRNNDKGIECTDKEDDSQENGAGITL